MRFKRGFTAILMATAAHAAHASNSEIAITPTPEWVTPTEALPVPDGAQGGIFFRKQASIVRLTEDGERAYQAQVVRILQPQALEAGNVAISWNPAAGEAEVHSLKIYRGSRVIDVLESTEFEILRREDQLEAAMLDGMLTAVLQVPDLRVGDDLELAFTVPSHDPTLRTTNHGLLFLGESPPSGRFHLELQWAEQQKPTIRLTPEFAKVAKRDDNRIALTFDNPEVLSPPRDAPPRFGWSRILEYSDFGNWPAVSRRFHALFDEARALPPKSPLRDEAALIAETHTDKLAQAQAALKLVQQQVRYIYIGLNGGNFTPATAEQTWERRYGDCKGKTAMLLALLDELGIEAQPVLVNNSASTDGLDDRLANPGLFDHVLVRARIGGEWIWLDGTLPEVIEGRGAPFLPYKWVLPLTETGAELEQLPQKPFEFPQDMGLYEVDARAGFEAPARQVYTTIKRGPAGLEEYFAFSAVAPNQLETAFRNQLAGSQGWDTVEDVTYRYDRETQASILTIEGTGPVEWEENGIDGRYFFLPGGGFSPPTRRQRSEEADKDIPFYQEPIYTCYVTTVRLPDNTALENWGFNSTFDTMLFGEVYYRMMERRDDRTLRMVRGNRVETFEIDQQRAQRDNGRLADFDNSKAILSYDPNETMEPWGNLRPVPATDEIDWTAKDVPCLPPDMLD
ncbi:DUF3857 domain-containing transglutaminase family protein [Erythrobacter sp. GH1-10]|uniref:DUF3857 domain-containing transglutaminase family protein n=1 Tax=Erythrobacter sp. GH1-10 TaxID=3349334 RepID=UPI003877F7DE